MERLIKISYPEDIPIEYQATPISLLLEYHNMDRLHDTYDSAQLLAGMCIDNRNQLRIPRNFAFIIRVGGANMRYSEFKVSFAIAIGQVRYIALIGHNHCGMVNLAAKQDTFVQGLVERAGWDFERAHAHFMHYAPMFETKDEIDFILAETQRLRLQYPKINIAPMLYIVEDNKLYLIRES